VELAFLPSLIHCSAVPCWLVEPNEAFAPPGQVRDDKPDPGEQQVHPGIPGWDLAAAEDIRQQAATAVSGLFRRPAGGRKRLFRP